MFEAAFVDGAHGSRHPMLQAAIDRFLVGERERVNGLPQKIESLPRGGHRRSKEVDLFKGIVSANAYEEVRHAAREESHLPDHCFRCRAVLCGHGDRPVGRKTFAELAPHVVPSRDVGLVVKDRITKKSQVHR